MSYYFKFLTRLACTLSYPIFRFTLVGYQCISFTLDTTRLLYYLTRVLHARRPPVNTTCIEILFSPTSRVFPLTDPIACYRTARW